MSAVVVVDDSAATRTFLSELATSAGAASVRACATGFDAMRELPRLDDVRLVITDVNMPDLTGLELLRMLRASDRWKSIPIFVVSTDAGPADRERAMSLGATNVFGKPFDEAEIVGAIREVLGRAR